MSVYAPPGSGCSTYKLMLGQRQGTLKTSANDKEG